MANNIEILIQAKDGFSKTFGAFGSVLGVAAKGLTVGAGAATAAAASLFAVTKQTAEAYDQVGKFSGRIGISTEALSAYHHVAEMSGVSQQQLNMGFQRMTRRISEASTGTGVAVKALDELGISIDDIHGRAPDVQFEMIAEAMEGVSNQSDKARLAMQFFDSEGVALLQTMSDGADGLREMKEEAERFGLVISQKAAVNAAAFNDSLSRAHGALRGLKNYVAEEAMPTFTGLADRFANFVAQNRAQIIDFAEDSVVALGGLVEFTAYGVAGMVDSWRGLKMIWKVLQIGFAEFTAFLTEGLVAIAGKTVETLEKLNFRGVFDEAIQNAKQFENSNRNAMESMREFAEATWAELDSIVNEGMAIDRVQDIAGRIKQTLAEIREEGDKGANIGITDSQVEKNEENVNKLTATQMAGIEALKAMRDEYYLTEQEKLDQWHATQQEKYAEHQEALALIDQIYAAKKKELDEERIAEQVKVRQRQLKDLEKFKRGEALAEKKAATERVKITNEREKAAYQIQTSFGVKGFNFAKLATSKETIMNMHSSAVGAYKAMAGIPVIGPALGVAAAAAALAYGAQQIASIGGLNIGGAAHGGLDFVPKEQTYLLDRGERVLSPAQNRDLTAALEGGGIGGPINIENMIFEILPNATSPGALLEMSREDWEEIAVERVLPAFRTLADQGQTI